MSSTVVAMMLATVMQHRHSDGMLGPDLALDRPTTSRQSAGDDDGPHRAGMATDGDATTFWRTGEHHTTGTIEIALAAPSPVDHVVLGEPPHASGRIRRFTIQARTVDGWTTVATGTTVGTRRVLQHPTVMANRIRITVERATSSPALAHVGVHSGPPSVAIVTDFPAFLDRTTAFLSSDRDHAAIHYTLDGTRPDRSSPAYRGGPIRIDRDLELRAIAFEGDRPTLDEASTTFVRYDAGDARTPARPPEWSTTTTGLMRLEPSTGARRVVERVAVEPMENAGDRLVEYEGLLRIPRDGVFVIHVTTDGIAEIRLDGTEAAPWRSTPGRSSLRRAFRAGWHPIRLRWAGPSDAGLDVEIEGPGLPRRSMRRADLAMETRP